jgi:predicted AAA+ superfamily ATPase
MYFKRDIEEPIKKQLSSPENHIILISGARQTGKTSIVENIEIEKEKLILDFWEESQEIKTLKNADTFELFEKYLKHFFGFEPNGRRVLIIDEAQASATLGRFIMSMRKKWKDQKVILLGSILSNLIQEDVPMPTGRVVEFVCRPLNFAEFLRFSGKDGYLDLLPGDLSRNEPLDQNLHALLMSEFEKYLTIGGLPGIVNAYNSNDDYMLLFESLLNNFYRDADRFIAKHTDITRSRVVQYGSLMEHCLKTIGLHVGFPTTNSTILSTDSPSYRTILPKVLEALRQWHLVYFIENETKQQTSKKGYSSKKYLFDTGLLNLLINHSMPVSLARPSELSAKLLESAVLQELVSRTGSVRRITSFKSSNKIANELDFVARIGNRTIPIEVKASSKINQKSISQVLSYLEISQSKRGIVVYTGLPKTVNISGFDLNYVPPYYLPIVCK